MNLNERLPEFGFYRNDGTLVPMSALNFASLEYVSFTNMQLQEMLQQEVQLERYEQCARLRDELLRRTLS